MRIGVISDTHGLLRPEAEAALAGADHILHAGDIGAPWIVSRLSAIAPVTAIRGNVDRSDWVHEFPDHAVVTLEGRVILMLHDLAQLGRDPAAESIDIVIFGHSHRPRVDTVDGVLYLNPGSAGPRRFRLPVTLAMLELGEGAPRATILRLVD